jgi:hypothetical protein
MLIKFSIFFLSLYFILCINKENPANSASIISPSMVRDGNLLTSKCTNLKISLLILTAQCVNNNQEKINSSINLRNCLKNNEGSLSLSDGRDDGLYIKSCRIEGNNLSCECQQMNCAWRECKKNLDEIFTVINGEIKC